MDIGQQNSFLTAGRGVAMLVVALMLAGCQTKRPDFTERSRQDCAQGDQEACRMLEALTASQAAPQQQRAVRPPPPRPSPVQTDVQAIMLGMEQARLSARTGQPENLPPPGAPFHDNPTQAQPPTGSAVPE